jgi:hypothetical protein
MPRANTGPVPKGTKLTQFRHVKELDPLNEPYEFHNRTNLEKFTDGAFLYEATYRQNAGSVNHTYRLRADSRDQAIARARSAIPPKKKNQKTWMILWEVDQVL